MDASYADVVRDQRGIGTLFIKGATEDSFLNQIHSIDASMDLTGRL